MLAFHHRVDLVLEAAFLLCEKYEQTQKHRRRGIVEVTNLSTRLSDDQIDQPETVIADRFITYSLRTSGLSCMGSLSRRFVPTTWG